MFNPTLVHPGGPKKPVETGTLSTRPPRSSYQLVVRQSILFLRLLQEVGHETQVWRD
jgi:hypothetical protein